MPTGGTLAGDRSGQERVSQDLLVQYYFDRLRVQFFESDTDAAVYVSVEAVTVSYKGRNRAHLRRSQITCHA
jgi:hypothetical protein